MHRSDKQTLLNKSSVVVRHPRSISFIAMMAVLVGRCIREKGDEIRKMYREIERESTTILHEDERLGSSQEHEHRWNPNPDTSTNLWWL